MRTFGIFALALAAMETRTGAQTTGPEPSVKFFTPQLVHAVYVADAKTDKGSAFVPASPSARDPIQEALEFAKSRYALQDDHLVVKSSHVAKDTGVAHVYLKQLLHDREIANADMNVNINRHGEIVSYGSSFVELPAELHRQNSLVAFPRDGLVDPVQAVGTMLTALGHQPSDNMSVGSSMLMQARDDNSVTVSNVPGSVKKDTVAKPTYLINEEGNLIPTWEIALHSKNDWVLGHVSQDSREVVSLISWKSDASYNVYGLGQFDPQLGKRQMAVDPAYEKSSPHGWHDDQNNGAYTTTRGNNVIAQQGRDGNSGWENKERPDGGEALVFDFPLDLTKQPRAYTDAAVVNVFYWNNIAHDIFYQYGFDEKAGNFQQNNFGKGGEGGDPVISYTQSGEGSNNAYFITPPDGESGEMAMFEFTSTRPNRDGDLESDVMVHEYSHGVTIRLTGGPSNSNCLQFGEAGGMGEGWGDFFSIMFRLNANSTHHDNFAVGHYVTGSPKGLRQYYYSTDLKTNPYTYETLNDPMYDEVHNMGEVWATMLNEVLWGMVDEVGLEPNIYNVGSNKGNILTMKYVMNGLKLQPCNPSFLDARNAILQAEKEITQGRYECTLWKAFAKRGLGKSARKSMDTRYDGNDVPSQCQA
ncbi:hypothetical protein H4R35_006623 [Dimargaris xerosporica]|nr:hypothetical protein H4R35_006623 [Dimargaris xerosporica]